MRVFCVVGRRARALATPGTRLDARDLFVLVTNAGGSVGAYEHDAAWVDVNDAAAVRLVQGIGHLDGDAQSLVRRQMCGC